MSTQACTNAVYDRRKPRRVAFGKETSSFVSLGQLTMSCCFPGCTVGRIPSLIREETKVIPSRRPAECARCCKRAPMPYQTHHSIVAEEVHEHVRNRQLLMVRTRIFPSDNIRKSHFTVPVACLGKIRRFSRGSRG